MERPKVLCIDDSPDVCVLVQRLLSPRCTVLAAGDGLQGIELAVDATPDLVLVDLQLPQLTGFEVATRLKSLMPEMPIIALTADVSTNVRERVLASGCDGYMAKPIDPDEFYNQIQAYLAGEREELEDDSFVQEYQQTLVARLEEKVRELTQALQENTELNERNLELLEEARRQTKLLEAGAKVARSITSILDLETLLSTTVDVISAEFDVYYVGIFLTDETNAGLELHAGSGTAGAAMLLEGYKIDIGADSPVGHATRQHSAIVTTGLDGGAEYLTNPHLPDTRSEMALPLMVGDNLIGALTVQSIEEQAFSEEDTTAFQSMADQLAIAINNATLLKELEAAHQQLVQTKTFQVIATATGEAIHWVGNKAAPIPGSVDRITDDMTRFLLLADIVLADALPELREHKLAQILTETAREIRNRRPSAEKAVAELAVQPLNRLRKMLNIESIFEDLEIIENSAWAILNIKEHLIGPARQQEPEVVSLSELLTESIGSMGIPKGAVRTLFAEDLLPVRADRFQLDRVFVNLIKNAMEAMEHLEDKKLFIWARPADEEGFVVIDVIDNGDGIPAEQLDKIWMAFYTTKGNRGGTGLGLPACAQIIGQLDGKITVDSEIGLGTTFSVFLPAVKETENVALEAAGRVDVDS